MSVTKNKNKVFQDYAAIIHGMLPEAEGLVFHNHLGKLFWRDSNIDNHVLTEAYKAALQNLLLSKAHDPLSCRLMMGDSAAYLLPIVNENGSLLGALTVLLPRDAADLPYRACHEKLRPALGSLGRELILRRNLSEVKNAGSSSKNEHKFLRLLPNQARHADGHEAAIREILTMSIDYLQLNGATLVVPDRQLQISKGSQFLATEDVNKMLQQLGGFYQLSERQLAKAHANGMEISGHENDRSWPILDEDNRLIGLLALSWPKQKSGISEASLSLAGFVVTTLELVLERAFDPLTGLLNWPAFESALSRAYDNNEVDYSLIYLDIDQLHVVNDTFGRNTGDEVMRHFAGILSSHMKEHTLTRITSDAFAVLLKQVSLQDTTQLADTVCKKLPEIEYEHEGKTYRPTVSVGVAPLIRGTDEGVRGALIPAQISCQAAKDRGRNRVETYASADVSIVQRIDDLHKIGSVRSAVEEGRLILFAQPLVRLDGDKSAAYHEVLVRLLDEDGEAIAPQEFLRAAERYQLMQELDQWVVSNSVEALTQYMQTETDHRLRLAINLSGQSVGNDQFLDFLKTELSRPGVSADRFCFEITENVAVQNIRKARAFMEEIKQLGCEFALDDFGTGQSSFTYLKDFPIDKLKIDGSFVADICDNPVSRAMVKAIADIAHVMNIETVAEYVTDDAVLEEIRDIGLDWAQGFMVGEPVRLSALLGTTDFIDAELISTKSDLPL